MIAAVISFLSGPLGKVVGYAALALGIWGAYELWEYKTEQRALSEFNRKQLEQVLKDKEKYIRQLEETRKIVEDVTRQVREANEQLEKTTKTVEDFLNSPEAIKQDKPASPLLKETIRKLGGK
jgi:uncharacterized protein HemX